MPKLDLDAILNNDALEVVVGGKTYRVTDVPLEFFLSMRQAGKIAEHEFATFIHLALKDQGMTEEEAKGLGFLQTTGLFRAIMARFFDVMEALNQDPVLQKTRHLYTPPPMPEIPSADSTGSGPSPSSSAPTRNTTPTPVSG